MIIKKYIPILTFGMASVVVGLIIKYIYFNKVKCRKKNTEEKGIYRYSTNFTRCERWKVIE